jgi:thiamine kinase-like enzyme
VLIDWEYAQVADPTYDVACLLVYYPRVESHLEVLLGAAGLDSIADRAALTLQRELFGCLNRLWGLANATESG